VVRLEAREVGADSFDYTSVSGDGATIRIVVEDASMKDLVELDAYESEESR